MPENTLSSLPIICIGDFILDKFVEGSVERISPEGPIPVLRESRHFYTLGGAGNVIRNISSLGHPTIAFGIVDAERSGKKTTDLLSELKAVKTNLITDATWLTPYKTRFTAQGQQLLRHDQERTNTLSPETKDALIQQIKNELPNASLLVFSDYDKGLLTESLCQELIQMAKKHGIPMVVDPKGKDYTKYKGVTLLTPNLSELRTITGLACKTHDEIIRAATALRKELEVKALLVTLSSDGMMLIDEEDTATHIPGCAKEVYDVSGAGDTVIATLSVCLSEGLPLIEACKLANQAGGIVVGKIGTAVIYRHELQELSHPDKVMTLPQVCEQTQLWKRQGYKVGFTNGCFDLLHLGHLHLLKQARSQCDRLILGLNTDSSIKRLKGESRPIQAEYVRAQILAALEIIDAVVLFDEDTPLNLIQEIIPDVLVKGADYTVETVVGADVVMKNGGRVFLAQLKDGFSTTSTVAKMKAAG